MASLASILLAVALGWLFYREPFGVREAIAMAIIFAGVAIVKRVSVAVRKLGAAGPVEGGPDSLESTRPNL